MKIIKSKGNNEVEKTLSQLCEATFLTLWSYPNLYKKKGDELCDLFAVFENNIFIFQAKSIKFNQEKDPEIAWERWKKKTISAQVTQLKRAKKWILQNPDKIYLDPQCQTRLPIKLVGKTFSIHQIIVAYGARDACKKTFDDSIYENLKISYSDGELKELKTFFTLHLDKKEIIHVFDSFNLEIILRELDTFYDFTSYILAKEEAIRKYDLLYFGEEDLLAHYFLNFDETQNAHFIGAKNKNAKCLRIFKGTWKNFVKSSPYRRRKEANNLSYLWDKLIQKTYSNALNGTLLGNGDIFADQSPIHEMAKEPRFSRRELSIAMRRAIDNFPENLSSICRNVSFMPSFYKKKGYVFLQIKHPNIVEYDNDYRSIRLSMLEIACGAAKNKFQYLKRIVGIVIDSPKFSKFNSEGFILMNCDEWSEKKHCLYDKKNKELKFFQSESMKVTIKKTSDFPDAVTTKIKVGKNESCPCGSGKKFKKCCESYVSYNEPPKFNP